MNVHRLSLMYDLACQLVNSVSKWLGIRDFVVIFILIFHFYFLISHFQFVQAPLFYLTHLWNQCIAPNRSADKLKSFAYKLTPAPGSICICKIMYLHTLPTPAASCISICTVMYLHTLPTLAPSFICIFTLMFLHILLTQVSHRGETIPISFCVTRACVVLQNYQGLSTIHLYLC